MNRKAQISIFIIIGVVLVFIAGITFFLIERGAEEPLEGVLAPRTEIAFQGDQDVREYVMSCLRPIVLEGLEIMRLQAGYIDIPATAETLDVKDWRQDLHVVESAGKKEVVKSASPLSRNQVPYWITATRSRIPSLRLMSSELENYIERELPECLGDYSEFKRLGFDVQAESPLSRVEFGRSVVVDLYMPVLLTRGEIRTETPQFIFEVPIDIELIHHIAKRIADIEFQMAYMERLTNNVIEHNSGFDQQDLPPVSKLDMGFSCRKTTWRISQVETNLKDVLRRNLNFVRIGGTNFTRIIRPNPISQGFMDSLIYDFFKEDYDHMKITHRYEPNWPIDLNIRPNTDGILSPSRKAVNAIPIMPMLCGYKYRFKYDLQYPVMISITDGRSATIDPIGNVFEEEKGYEFMFPMKVALFGNQERVRRPSREPEQVGINLNELIGKVKSPFCQPNMRTTEKVTIRVSDADQPSIRIPDAEVVYKCGLENPSNTCSMGQTDEDGELETNFPPCVNGHLKIIRRGYKEAVVRDFSSFDAKGTYRIRVELEKNISIEIEKLYIPGYIKNYMETNGFRNVSVMLQKGKELGYDINPFITSARTLGIDMTTRTPRIDISGDPQGYCDIVRNLLSRYGLSAAPGEPVDLYPDNFIPPTSSPDCSIGSYDITQGRIISQALDELASGSEYLDFKNDLIKNRLISKIPLEGSEQVLITIQGIPTTFLKYPQLGNYLTFHSGTHLNNLIFTSNLAIENTAEERSAGQSAAMNLLTGDTADVPSMPLGTTDYVWKVEREDLLDVDKIRFTALANYRRDDITNWDELDLIHNTTDNSLKAEVLIDVRTNRVTKVSGLNKVHFGTITNPVLREGRIIRVPIAVPRHIRIPYSEYQRYIMPEIVKVSGAT